MKIVENNKIICDTKDLMKIFKERQLAVKISNEGEYDIFIEMAKEAGFYIPEGLCFGVVKKRPCLHLSQLTVNNRLYCDTEEWCREEGFIRPYKVVSYDEFIHMGCEPVAARGNGKGMRTFKVFLDEFDQLPKPEGFEKLYTGHNPFDEFKKSIHQGLVDKVMNQPYDIHISSDGKTSTARFYVNGKLVRTAEAKCHPVDRFNFHTGAEVAFNRLWEKQTKEKKTPKFKPGDKIRVKRDLEAGIPYGDIGTNHFMVDMRGNVVTVSGIELYEYATSGIIIRIEEDQGQWCWTPEMFELV